MKTKQELHAAAIDLLDLIGQAEKKKETLYRNYRNWCHFSSREHLEKHERNIDVLDRAISRINESYKKVMQQIIIDL